MKAFKFEPNIYDIIRKNIKKYRKEANMTSAELAEAVELSHDFIRQISLGPSKIFKNENFGRS